MNSRSGELSTSDISLKFEEMTPTLKRDVESMNLDFKGLEKVELDDLPPKKITPLEVDSRIEYQLKAQRNWEKLVHYGSSRRTIFHGSVTFVWVTLALVFLAYNHSKRSLAMNYIQNTGTVAYSSAPV